MLHHGVGGHNQRGHRAHFQQSCSGCEQRQNRQHGSAHQQGIADIGIDQKIHGIPLQLGACLSKLMALYLGIDSLFQPALLYLRTVCEKIACS